jgi:hypothetical protein
MELNQWDSRGCRDEHPLPSASDPQQTLSEPSNGVSVSLRALSEICHWRNVQSFKVPFQPDRLYFTFSHIRVLMLILPSV